jgi:hypothetical protein
MDSSLRGNDKQKNDKGNDISERDPEKLRFQGDKKVRLCLYFCRHAELEIRSLETKSLGTKKFLVSASNKL